MVVTQVHLLVLLIQIQVAEVVVHQQLVLMVHLVVRAVMVEQVHQVQ